MISFETSTIIVQKNPINRSIPLAVIAEQTTVFVFHAKALTHIKSYKT